MHPEALEAVAKMMVASGYSPDRASVEVGHPIGLDVGGADVNGTARAVFPDHIVWFGLDVEPGPGVDFVADATNWVCAVPYDVVLCTELLEHVKDWPAVIRTIWDSLAPGGYAFITCAGTDGETARRPHGARGALDPAPGEWYANVHASLLLDAIAALGHRPALAFGYSAVEISGGGVTGHVEYNPNPGDCYAWIRK